MNEYLNDNYEASSLAELLELQRASDISNTVALQSGNDLLQQINDNLDSLIAIGSTIQALLLLLLLVPKIKMVGRRLMNRSKSDPE